MRILLVEDDELLGHGVREGLKHYEYAVEWVKDGKAGEHAICNENFDAILLDIGLPKQSGYEVLKKVRDAGVTTPVLILTARELVEDRVKGLDLGADDYIVKPFNLKELCARLRALQRRFNSRTAPFIEYKGIVLDPAAHIVTYQNEEVSMTRREFALLKKLLENIGKVISREHLSQTVYCWNDDIDSNALEVHIHNLRKKFGLSFIRTIRGVGYVINAETQEPEEK